MSIDSPATHTVVIQSQSNEQIFDSVYVDANIERLLLDVHIEDIQIISGAQTISTLLSPTRDFEGVSSVVLNIESFLAQNPSRQIHQTLTGPSVNLSMPLADLVNEYLNLPTSQESFGLANSFTRITLLSPDIDKPIN